MAAQILDLSEAVGLRVAGYDAEEVRVANQTIWRSGPVFEPNQIVYSMLIRPGAMTGTLFLQATTGTTFTVDWGDGNVSTFNGTGVATNQVTVAVMRRAHTYQNPGTYRVVVTGQIVRTGHGSQPAAEMAPLLGVDYWGHGPVSLDAQSMFANCFQDPDLADRYRVAAPPPNVTSVVNMFSNATAFNSDLRYWDLTNISGANSANNMFWNCHAFDGDLTGWVVNNTVIQNAFTSMQSFTGRGLETWDVSRVTSMLGAFFSLPAFDANLAGWDVTNVTSMNNMFQDASNFTGRGLETWDVSRVTSMANMFRGAASFVGNSIGGWDVSGCQDMAGMFWDATSFNGPIGGWNKTNVTTMADMFRNAHAFNQDLNGWDMSRTFNTLRMFQNARTFDGDTTGWRIGAMSCVDMFRDAVAFTGRGAQTWDVSGVSSMASMFEGASAFNAPIGSWDVYRVSTMARMFFGATSFNQDLHNWNTYHLSTTAQMFQEATAFNGRVDGWNTDRVATTAGMFMDATSYNRPIVAGGGRWNLSNCLNTGAMFRGATSLNSDIQNLDLRNATGMGLMFAEATSFNGDVSGWTIGPANSLGTPSLAWLLANNATTGVNAMFANATAFRGRGLSTWDMSRAISTVQMFAWSHVTEDLTGWNLSSLRCGTLMFRDAPLFNGDVSDWLLGPLDVNTNTVTSSTFQNQPGWRIFMNAPNFTGRGMNSWNVSHLTNMANMFNGVPNFNAPLHAWDVSNVTNMQNMFQGCGLLNQDFTGWRTGNVTNFSNMFQGCTEFDGSVLDWDLSSAVNMASMFAQARRFRGIGLGSWDTGNVEGMGSMFSGAWSFSGNLSGWNTSNVLTMASMFSSAWFFNTDIGNWDVRSITNANQMASMFNGDQMTFSRNLTRWDVQRFANQPSNFTTSRNVNIGGVVWPPEFQPRWGQPPAVGTFDIATAEDCTCIDCNPNAPHPLDGVDAETIARWLSAEKDEDHSNE